MMRAKSLAEMRCSVASALGMIGDRWSLLVIWDLSFGLRRFKELRTSTGIPSATLAARLKHLEARCIIERVRYHNRPPRDEYHLTPKGRDMWKVSTALREWGDRWDSSGEPTFEMVDRKTGRRVILGLVDVETNRAVSLDRVQLRPGPGADDAMQRLLDPESQGSYQA